MTDWDPEAFANGLIEDMRAHDGYVTDGHFAGSQLLVLYSTGAKTGQPRRSVLAFTRDADAYVVAGSKSGAPTDPSWIHNLMATPSVTIEVENWTTTATASFAQGADRDRLWEQHVAARPGFAEYPPKAQGRVIPMVRLTPTSKD